MIPRYLYESSRQCERGGLRRWESAMAGAPAVCAPDWGGFGGLRSGRFWMERRRCCRDAVAVHMLREKDGWSPVE